MLSLLYALGCDSGTGSDTGDSGCDAGGCDSGESRRVGSVDLDEADGVLGGAAAEAEFGAAVAIGDATGDGVGDLLVGARGASSGRGEAWLFAGPIGPGVADSTLAAAHLVSADTVQLGTEGCLGADLTGDGVGDLVVGARAWMREPLGGAAFLVPGPVAGEVDVGADAHVLLGAEEGDLFGVAVSCGGDATGDGAADLLVGARSRDGHGVDAGAAFLFAGPVSAEGPAGAALVLRGEGADDAAARAVDLRGDLDGDGLVDLVVGAYRQSAEVPFGGAVYVVNGGASGVVDLGDADVVLRSTEEGASAGRALSSAGDLDGDGLADLAVGLSGVNGLAGAVVVLASPLPATGGLREGIARVDAALADGNAGFAVLSGVDVDGDGVSELGVGAPGQHGDGQGTLPGEVSFFYGPLAGTSAFVDAPWRVTTPSAGVGLGYALAGGDLDGDALGDLAIGAPFASVPTGGAGAVAVLFGVAP